MTTTMKTTTTTTSSSSSLQEKAKYYIPAEVRMLSGCRDAQTSADLPDVQDYSLRDVAGSSGGAFTTTLLEILYRQEKICKTAAPAAVTATTTATTTSTSTTEATEAKKKSKLPLLLSYGELMTKMKNSLLENGFSQLPQMSSSRPIDLEESFQIVSNTTNRRNDKDNEDHIDDDNDDHIDVQYGTRRAVLIGINYVGMDKLELDGCHNDCQNMATYLQNVHGFENENITILMDDGKHTSPTRQNILNAYKVLVRQCEAGDDVFCYFAGHGGQRKDISGDEDDGYDETVLPVDYKTAGRILDDELFMVLVSAMPAGVHMTCIVDCCHSGTILDLPFVFSKMVADTDEKKENIEVDSADYDETSLFPHMAAVKRDRFWNGLKQLFCVR